jgi:hypothetical protein
VDVGGATGVYAAPLAVAGYDVHVVDPVPGNVAVAGALPGVTAAVGDARELPVESASADATLLLGHHNPDAVPGWFTTAYFHRPDEIAAEAVDAGLRDARVLAVEGPLWLLGDARLDDAVTDVALLLRILRRIEAEPSLLGASSHQLTVARVG